MRQPFLINLFLKLFNCFCASSFLLCKRSRVPLLKPQNPEDYGKNTLVLDLDETLIHSSFTSIPCDISIEISINSQDYNVYSLKRPNLDNFLKKCCELYEVVIFTASLKEYADPLIDFIDNKKKVKHNLS